MLRRRAAPRGAARPWIRHGPPGTRDARPAMLLLVNSTRTMDLGAPVPPRLRATTPRFAAAAAELQAALGRLGPAALARAVDARGALADRARADLARWGRPDNPRRPACLAFGGLVFRALDAASLDAGARRRARRRLRILSGLYGLLDPYDAVEAYRLEMGSRWRPPGAADLVRHWRARVTAALAAELRPGEPVVAVASQEYLRAVDADALPGPLLLPVFRERRPDGGLGNAPVHAKTARGALLRHALVRGARRPADLAAFGDHGWEAEGPPPAAGRWLFTRPARG